PLGGWGLFAASFLDSSFLAMPGGVDVWLISLCAWNPSRMPRYVLATITGSVAGCSVLYFLLRKGEDRLLRGKRDSARLARARHWVEKYGPWSLVVAAVLPPPAPFKMFVIAGALLQIPFLSFVGSLLVGRSVRYFLEGYLAARYGREVWEWLSRSAPIVFVVAALLMVIALLLATRLHRRTSPQPSHPADH
ncbi:MAG: DedA family protein, partial [Acidobacteria bacterium]|nr:DedA family protein [Acidobacteriota bacterium]